MDKPLWMWAFFMGVVIILLTVDLGIVHRKQRIISVKESLWMSAFYISIGLLFGGWVWFELGPQSGRDYITGFLIEKSLSVDNIFLISLIFMFENKKSFNINIIEGFAVPTGFEPVFSL